MSRVIECPDCGWQSSSQGSPWTVLSAHKPHCAAGNATCDVCEDVAWLVETGETDPAAVASRIGKSPAALEKHLRRCGRGDLRAKIPRLSAAAAQPKPITTTTKEKEPMETPTMPAPETLVDHDNRRVAKAAERVLVAQEALREAWEADAGKAALRAKRDRLKAQLAEVEAELKGAAPKPKPAPAPEAKVDSRDVRIWALTNGYDVPERGPISVHIRAAYDEAMRGGAA